MIVACVAAVRSVAGASPCTRKAWLEFQLRDAPLHGNCRPPPCIQWFKSSRPSSMFSAGFTIFANSKYMFLRLYRTMMPPVIGMQA